MYSITVLQPNFVDKNYPYSVILQETCESFQHTKENKLLYSLGDAWPTGGKNIFITDLSDKGKSLIKMEVENKMYILDYELNNNELVLKIIYFDQGYYSANTKRVYINYKELNKELTIKRDVFLR